MDKSVAPILGEILAGLAKAAEYLGKIPATPAISTALWVLIAGFALWWLVVKLDSLSGAPWWPFSWPWWGKLPLDVAARIAFRRLDQTLWVDWATKRHSEEERIDLMAENIADEAPLWGRRPPAELEKISRLVQEFSSIQGGGKRLHILGNSSPRYEDLHIERSRLWVALRSMKQQTKLRDELRDRE